MKLIADVLVVLGSLVGSTLIALNVGLNELGYICFIVASVFTMYLLLNSTASRSLLLVNLYFLIINVVGLFRY